MVDVVFDLETGPLCSKEEFDGLKDSDKKDCCLNPWKARVTSVCYTVDGVSFPVFAGFDERELLENFWFSVLSKGPSRFIGFNNSVFDNHFLMVRTVVNGLDYGFSLVDFGCSVDLRSFLLSGSNKIYGSEKYRKGKLQDFCKRLGVDEGDWSNDGSECVQHFFNGDWSKIISHNKEDVLRTWLLYDKVKKFL